MATYIETCAKAWADFESAQSDKLISLCTEIREAEERRAIDDLDGQDTVKWAVEIHRRRLELCSIPARTLRALKLKISELDEMARGGFGDRRDDIDHRLLRSIAIDIEYLCDGGLS